jgi:hypothetical protein
MTLAEKILKDHPEMKMVQLLNRKCPSDFGIKKDLCKSSKSNRLCWECWNQKTKEAS